jgi:hypothetical protein
MELDYFVVDVFTDTAPAGNPLAVVLRPAAVEQAEGVRVAWRSAGRAISTCQLKSKAGLHGWNRRGSPMCAWRAAPFLWQKDSFSCRNAHAFNRLS